MALALQLAQECPGQPGATLLGLVFCNVTWGLYFCQSGGLGLVLHS